MKFEYFGFLLTLSFTLTLGAGDHPYEWGGIFETPESNYMWTSQKVNAQYADPSLTMVAWPVTTFTEEALKALEEQAEEAMNMTCTDVQAGGTIVPASNTCFRLVFQEILAGGLGGLGRFFHVSSVFLYFRSCLVGFLGIRECEKVGTTEMKCDIFFLGWRSRSASGLLGSPSTTSTPARQQALPSSRTTCPRSLKLRPTTSRTITATTSSRRRPSRRQQQKRLKRPTGALLCWEQ